MSKAKVAAKKASQGSSSTKKTLMLLTMVAPGAVWLVLIRYLPMFGILLAFKEHKVYASSGLIKTVQSILEGKWVGFNNFQFLFAGNDAGRMIFNTLAYNIFFIVVGTLVAIAFAIMMNEVTKKFVARTYQTLMFFPYFLSWVVVSYFVLAFLDPTRGMISHIMADAGNKVNFYTLPGPWPFILIFAYLWKTIGYSTLLYVAAITGIDGSQYEAAAIDGATKWQQVKHITLPHLKTMIIILFIMNVGKIFNADFGLFWTVPMNSGTLIPVTEVIDTFVYRALKIMSNTSMATAAGLLQNVIGFICIMTANTIVRRVDSDSSLF